MMMQVTPFSRWERELPKLVDDTRYKAIDKPKDRRQIFDDFCKNVAEEQKRSKYRKEQQAAAAVPAFLSLLDEAQAWVEPLQDAGAALDITPKLQHAGASARPQISIHFVISPAFTAQAMCSFRLSDLTLSTGQEPGNASVTLTAILCAGLSETCIGSSLPAAASRVVPHALFWYQSHAA